MKIIFTPGNRLARRALDSHFGKVILALLLLLPALAGHSQTTVPFTINNNSPYADSELYVAVVAQDPVSKNHVWINLHTAQVQPMATSDNTMLGPTYHGDGGPGLNSMYANCFFKLSTITNKTFSLPGLIGCRVYMSLKKPLYFYFYGSIGGYSAPNNLNSNDPNQNITFEYIELTNDATGFYGNTSRVDAFQYPMGLEVYGTNGYYKKVGDLKTKAEVLTLFQQRMPAIFQGCVNDSGQIWAPAKSPDFYDGSASGTVAGVQANYFKAYVDSIWGKYTNEDLIFYAGDAGTFQGRVIGGQLQCHEINGHFSGKTGTVAHRPNTQAVFEGKGVLDSAVSATTDTVDKVVEAQLTAAINRHMVNVTTPNVGLQNWYDTAQFYKAAPMNYYAWFWHQPGVCINRQAYGFCYDDVADQSPSIHAAVPTHIIATFGGYAGISCDSTAVTPRLTVNGGALQTTANATIATGDSILLSPAPAGGNWHWTGPNGFTSTASAISFTNAQPALAGTYYAVYTNACGTHSNIAFHIAVTGATSGCAGAGPNAPGSTTPDYSWQATNTANPVITFTPGSPIAGSTMAIMYVKIGVSGGYAGYVMNASGSSFFKAISAAAGAQVSMYFTYRVGNTSVERNSAATPHAFTVGGCGGSNNVPPVVSITSPVANATYNAPGSVTINATATDSDCSISKVEFYNGSTKIGESTASPYSFTWTGVAAGTYSLHAVATDNQSATTTSAGVNITVAGSTGGGCNGTGPVAAGQSAADYSYTIATNGNVNVTFIPGTPISGCDLALFYYRTGNGGWMGYTMSPSATGFTASVAIAGGSAIQFYFTYRRSAGGMESNSSASPHNYTVGMNCGMARRANPLSSIAGDFYPNPATDQLILPAAVETGKMIMVRDITGRNLPITMLNDRTLDISALAPGVYTITFISNRQKVVGKFVKN